MLTRVATLALVFGLTLTERAEAQTPKPTSEQKTSVATPQEPEDPLGRDTPRSAVMTFLKAIQKENYERATEYLDSRIKTSRAAGTGSTTRRHSRSQIVGPSECSERQARWKS